VFDNFIMSAVRTVKSRSSGKTRSLKMPLKQAQNRVLAPIYDKVALLRQELELKQASPTILMSE
jgi:hypothetical protein